MKATPASPTEASTAAVHERGSTQSQAAGPTQVPQRPGFRSAYWLALPLLAIGAYITVLRVGFLADDLVLLDAARTDVIGVRSLLPLQGETFYRPVGLMLTWKLGWQLWGFNPLPLHLQGLLIHAAVSLVLGLWLAEATSRRVLGWLAGAIFAVLPIHTEAVGWLAAQWDLWATLFALLSLLLFTRWWKARRPSWYLYAGSVLCFALGLFAKESLITFIPLILLSAWITERPTTGQSRRRLAYAMLPFCLVLAANVGIRLVTWGSIGGYKGLESSYLDFFWDGYTHQLRGLLSPVNPAVFGDSTVQVVGACTSLLILAGVLMYGRTEKVPLGLAAAWLAVTLFPVLNLPVRPDDLQQNRFLYLPAVGYSAGIAAIVCAAISGMGRQRRLALVGVCGLLALSGAACWVQLRPWHTTTVQAEEIDRQLQALVPPQPNRPQGMTWYVENVPDNYKGAYLFRIGLGNMRGLATGDGTWIENTESAVGAPLWDASSKQDVFAMRFSFDRALTRFRVAHIAGITMGSAKPEEPATGNDLKVADFTNCASDVLDQWHPEQATYHCVPGEGLVFKPGNEDSRLVNAGANADAPRSRGGFTRVRVAVSYPAKDNAQGLVNQWYWSGQGEGFSEERLSSLPIVQDGKDHTYWAFVRADQSEGGISMLRFDPVNAKMPVTIRWLAIDTVP